MADLPITTAVENAEKYVIITPGPLAFTFNGLAIGWQAKRARPLTFAFRFDFGVSQSNFFLAVYVLFIWQHL